MTNCNFICGVHNIVIDDDLGEGIQLVPNEKNEDYPIIKITNNKEKIDSLLSPNLAELIGVIEYSHLSSGYPIIAFCENKFDSKQIDSIEHLDKHLYLLKVFFHCLWLVKNNAADFDIGFLEFVNYSGIYSVSSNNMSTTNFDYLGNRSPTKFSKPELQNAIENFGNTLYVEHKKGKPRVANNSSMDRISIANNFLQMAISSKDLGMKAVGYCSALETLFSNGENTELAHKLSERIAKFLEKDLDKRKIIYKSVKKIYEVRSKVVHGSTFREAKTDEIVEIIKDADEICRRILTYIYSTADENIFEKSKENLDLFFTELILN